MKHLLVAVLLAVGAAPAGAQAPSVMGTWLTASKAAQVRLAPCVDPARGPVCGTIMKLLDPKDLEGKPIAPDDVIDIRNGDPALRGRKILGMVLLYDFKPAGEPNGFENGTIYNAENGKTYRANLALQPDGTLRLRGYVGTPLFGETQIWTRIQ